MYWSSSCQADAVQLGTQVLVLQTVMMMLRLLLTFALAASSVPRGADSVQYRAAAAVLPGERSSRATLAHFEALAHRASAEGAQLIVFPEAALWDDDSRKHALAEANAVGRTGSTPCDADPEAAAAFPQVSRLSCIARAANLVLVANVLSKVSCEAEAGASHGGACPKDGHFVYNSDVVHDEHGRLLATYFKRHDYKPLDVPALLPVSFNTSFGVEFGVFVCYDMTFSSPADQLAARGIRNFVFSTHWANEPPLQTAVASQQGWSRWFGANLIASNIADKLSHAGSGIYEGGEPTRVAFNVSSGAWPMADTLLIADLESQPAFPPAIASSVVQRSGRAAAQEATAAAAAAAAVEVALGAAGQPCAIRSADDAHSGTCTILSTEAATGLVTLTASDTDKHSGATVLCEATLQLPAGGSAAAAAAAAAGGGAAAAGAEPYALYASAWRATSRLDVCALLPCRLDVNGTCPPTYIGSLPASAVRISMRTSGGAAVRVVSPLVSVGAAELLPRAATTLAVSEDGASTTLNATLAAAAATVPASGSSVSEGRPLYTAAIYAVDSTSPDHAM
jgi:predicted amidohydrolase